MEKRPVALITGASRSNGIGSSVALTLAKSGWDIAFTYWRPYDESMPWGSRPDDVRALIQEIEDLGGRAEAYEADLSLPDSPSQIFSFVENALGNTTALVMSHCHSVDSDFFSTTIESFDLHFAVNSRATWLLIREFGSRFAGEPGSGRIIGITSDHTVGNLPYGASKGAMDRIVIAAASEFRDKGIRANVINPGATDTGWMTDEIKLEIKDTTFGGRLGKPQDAANLVGFLCSREGGWINGQLLYSNGGIP